MATTVRLNVSAFGGGPIYTAYSGIVQAGIDNTVTVDSRDVPALLADGATYVAIFNGWQVVSAPRAASAGRIVASTGLANGSLTLAYQPDVPRQCAAILAAGSTAITAGSLTVSYLANDATNPQVDVFSLVGSTAMTLTTSKGMLHYASAVVAGLAGGGGAAIQINDTNSLSIMVPTGFQDFTVLKETAAGADETIGTVASSAASINPSTTPNGSATFSWAFQVAYPGV